MKLRVSFMYLNTARLMITFVSPRKSAFPFTYKSKVTTGIKFKFLGRLGAPKRLTNASRTYFRLLLTVALLESAEGETKVCSRTGYRTRDLLLLSQTPELINKILFDPSIDALNRTELTVLTKIHCKTKVSQWAFGAKMTSYRRQCDVITSPCARWGDSYGNYCWC